MTLHIYGDTRSGNCLKVKWTAEKLGMPYEWTQIDTLSGATRKADFLRLNPDGQVPIDVLDDGRVLYQSNAIILHLADGSNLIPKDPYDKAKMFEWLFWEQYSHEPYVAVARFQVRYLGREASDLDPKLVERAYGALARLDDALTGRDFLVGGRLTLADISLVAYSRMASDGGLNLAAYPALRAWIARVEGALDLGPYVPG